MIDLRTPAKNKSTTLLVLWPIFFVVVHDTYLDMNQEPRLEDEPKSGAIWWIYFFADAHNAFKMDGVL